MIASRGQLSFSQVESIVAFGQVTLQVNGTGTAAIVADPADANKQVVRFQASASSANQIGKSYILDTASGEVWCEFEMQYADASSSNAAMLMVQFLTDADAEICRLARINPTTTRWGNISEASWNAGGNNFSTAISRDTWVRVRLRYKAGAAFQAWLWNGTSWDEVLNDTTVTVATDVKKIVLQSQTLSTLGGEATTKEAYFRRFAWDALATSEGTYQGWIEEGLQFGAVCSASSASTIDARMQYHFDWNHYGGDGLTSPVAQFQYKASSSGTWLDSGSPVALAAGTDDDCIVNHTITGLAGLTAYDFRVNVTHNTGVAVVTSNTITCTTPSAASGTAGTLKFAWGSCEHQGTSVFEANPKKSYPAILAQAPHGFFHLGDNAYMDNVFGGTDQYGSIASEVDYREKYRGNLVHDPGRRAVAKSAGQFLVWDDHEINVDNAVASDITAAASNAADDYLTDRRLNAIAGGRGFSFDTAKCRFIVLDTKTGKDLSGTDKVLGDTQKAAVLALLADTGKPINFLMCPGPLVQDHGGSSGADCYNETADTRAERDELLAEFHDNNPEGSILIICTGDRHFTYAATDWAADYGGRIKQEFCASPIATRQRDPDTAVGLAESGNTTIDFKETSLGGAATCIFRYGLLTIDESALTVNVSLRDENGELYDDDFAGSEAAAASGPDLTLGGGCSVSPNNAYRR